MSSAEKRARSAGMFKQGVIPARSTSLSPDCSPGHHTLGCFLVRPQAVSQVLWAVKLRMLMR